MEIRVEPHGPHVAIITIDNQPRRNAMSRPMMAELVRVWEELERSSCRCIVLTGAGDKAFSAGADLSGDLSARQETARVVGHALLKQQAYSKPIVAAVNGDCVGGVQQIAANRLLVKNRAALGCSLRYFRWHAPDKLRRSVDELLGWYAEGKLRPCVTRRLPLGRSVEAIRLLTDRKAHGKVVIVPELRES